MLGRLSKTKGMGCKKIYAHELTVILFMMLDSQTLRKKNRNYFRLDKSLVIVDWC